MKKISLGLLVLFFTVSVSFAVTDAEFVDDLPLRPVIIGNPINISNSQFAVSLLSDKYVYFQDFQSLFIWAHVKNKVIVKTNSVLN